MMYQTTTSCRVSLIKCGSVASRPSWCRMSPIELNSAGIVWALNHSSHYLRSCDLIKLHLDHLPLVTLLQGPLENISERMMRLRAEMLDYQLKILYTPGKRHQIAECLGRRPLFKAEEGWKYYNLIVPYCTVLYSTYKSVQYCTLLDFTVHTYMCFTLLYFTVHSDQYCTVLYCTVLYST
jgi:hypothetical protein